MDAKGKPIYDDTFGQGQTCSFEINSDLKELFLVVSGTPTRIMPIDMTGDFRSLEQEIFPYNVKLVGCEPTKVPLMDPIKVAGKPHVNGGGFVADTVKVDATVYIGPKAKVLGQSVVRGKARIEDDGGKSSKS